MKIIDCLQGSEEWFEARLGYVTSSNFHKVLNKKTGRGLYMRKLAAERLTGLREQDYKNEIMENGNIVEDEARHFYEAANDCKLRQAGFVIKNRDVGGSPDGLVGEDGIIEAKCPLSSTHIEYIMSNRLPTCYVPQIQGLLWVTDRQWCDFISYDPRVVSMPIFVIRVERDMEYIKELAGKVGLFVKELKDITKKIDDDF